MAFEIAHDIKDDSWFIVDREAHYVLNAEDINGDEYKNLFTKTREGDSLKSTFNDRKSAEKVFDNLDKIYKNQQTKK